MGDTYPFNDNKYAKKEIVRPETAEPVDRILHKIRRVCEKRQGDGGIRALGKMFRLYDRNHDHAVSKEELEVGLRKYGISLTVDEINVLFRAFDRDGSESIDFDELLREIRPPMSEGRLKLIELAFAKLDKTGDGVITVEDMEGRYDPRQHPKYKSGEYTKKQCFQEFLDTFQSEGEKDEKVTKQEFTDYYCGVSMSIDKHVYFDYVLRQAWNLN